MNIEQWVHSWIGEPQVEPAQIIQSPQIVRGALASRFMCQKPEDLDGPISGEWDLELKIDGVCCLYIEGRLLTIEGNPLNAATHTLDALKEMERLAGGHMFFHGEYVEPAGFDATLSALKSGKGQGTLFLHEMVPLEDWERNRQPSMTRASLKESLRCLVDSVKSPWVGFIPSRRVKARDLAYMFNMVGQLGQEGVVLKHPEAGYRRAVGQGWYKAKIVRTLDVPVFDIVLEKAPGIPLSGGKKPTIIVKGPHGPMAISEGLERKDLAYIATALNGNVTPMVEIDYFQRVGAKNGGSPRFVRLRPDKEAK